MLEITDAYTSLSMYCISNPFKFSAEIRMAHKKIAHLAGHYLNKI